MAFIKTNVRRLGLAIGAAVTLSFGIAQNADAQNIGANVGAGFSKGIVRSSNPGIGTFNWLAKRTEATSVRVALVAPKVARQLRKGSWICSPAGFGHKSRCYSN